VIAKTSMMRGCFDTASPRCGFIDISLSQYTYFDLESLKVVLLLRDDELNAASVPIKNSVRANKIRTITNERRARFSFFFLFLSQQ